MVRHHRLLYADLADPLGLLRQNRTAKTKLSEFWHYAVRDELAPADRETSSEYSELMAASQALVSDEILHAYDFGRHESVLDVGGGHGALVGSLAEKYAVPRLGILDLPEVVAAARQRLATSPIAKRLTFHPADFLKDPVPQGYDCVTLVRILHDHDDGPARHLLENIRSSLASGGRLVIAEPMAGTRGARAMGDAYFGFYLWAMRSGRPRKAEEIGRMLELAGFASWRQLRTRLPVVTSMIVATNIH